MPKKKLKHEIISYTYKANGKFHTATLANQDKNLEKDLQQGMLPAIQGVDHSCSCGQTKCVDKHLWRCMDIDGQGTCVWFITNEACI